MTANNETGAIQPISELADICRHHGIPFHTDATQAIGKINVDVDDSGIDLLTLSGHKINGPKGIGALYIRKGVTLVPLVHGGKQEGGLRAGTENVAGIVGLGKAAELAVQRLTEMERVTVLRDRLERGIREIVPEAKLNGNSHKRLPNTLNIYLPGVRGESVVIAMDQQGVSFSSGSACRSGSPKPSHALLAMGLSDEEAHCAIRLSLGIFNTEEEIDRTIDIFEKVLKNAGLTVRFVPCR
jgi:cysteine sulfinate desulfinase/cysteine desulfurase-like protein